jgi:hypothetical protein
MVLALLATDDLGRVLRVQAKPLCGRFASLDTATPAKGGQLRGGRGRSRTRSGYERRTSAQGRRAISVPLAWVTRGQPRLLGIIRVASSAPLTGVTARLPKLIVRVRFSSPALIVKAQARGESRAWALIVPGRLLISRAISVQLTHRDQCARLAVVIIAALLGLDVPVGAYEEDGEKTRRSLLSAATRQAGNFPGVAADLSPTMDARSLQNGPGSFCR